MASGSVFQFSGIGSGFSTDTILQKMLDVERAPIQTFQGRQAQVTQEQTAWRSINTKMLALGSAADKLMNDDEFSQRQAISSDPDILTATAQPGKDLGSLSLSVESLAQNHQQISQGFATTDSKVGTGTITLKVGSASYNPIQVTNGTLQGLRDAINGANLGVTASILDAGSGAGNDRYRLMLNSNVTGMTGQITPTFNLSGGTVPAMTDLVAAQDAHIKLGSGSGAIDIYSSTNVVTDAVPGVSLNLKAAKPGTTVNVQMNQANNGLRNDIQAVLDQYNGLVDSFNANNKYDKDTQSTGILFGDSGLQSLQSRLFNTITASREVGGAFNSLTSIGINVDAKGKLAITDSSKFDAALSKPGDLKKLFSDSTNGIAKQLKTLSDGATNVVTGTITLEDKRLSDLYGSLDKNITATNEKVARTEERLRLMFLNMESALSSLKSQGQAISAQLASLPTISSSSSKKDS